MIDLFNVEKEQTINVATEIKIGSIPKITKYFVTFLSGDDWLMIFLNTGWVKKWLALKHVTGLYMIFFGNLIGISLMSAKSFTQV